MSEWGDVFGANTVIGQLLLYQVAGQLIGPILSPVLTAVQQELWSLAIEGDESGVYVAPSPADLAEMVVRNIRTLADAEGMAAKSGMAPTDFDDLVAARGNPPGPEFLADLTRKQLIPEAGTGPDEVTYDQGVAEGDTKNKWAESILKGTVSWPTPAEVVVAAIRNQLTQAAAGDLYGMVGGNPDYFMLLQDIAGNPPSPGELVEFVRRGLIPLHGTGPDALTFEQGIFEGDTKDKWEPLYEQLTVYIPPPRTVTTLLSHGVITTETANELFKMAGLSDELAAAYVASATSEKLASAKALTVGNVEKLYFDQLITNEQATAFLSTLGYAPAEAAYVLELQDFSRAQAAYTSAVGRVGTLYTSRKITRQSAVEALQQLDVPAVAVTRLMSVWDTQEAANVKVLTPSQIALAVSYAVMSPAEGLRKLQDEGYTPYDAWVLLGVESKGPVGTAPADTAPSSGGVPVTEE